MEKRAKLSLNYHQILTLSFPLLILILLFHTGCRGWEETAPGEKDSGCWEGDGKDPDWAQGPPGERTWRMVTKTPYVWNSEVPQAVVLKYVYNVMSVKRAWGRDCRGWVESRTGMTLLGSRLPGRVNSETGYRHPTFEFLKSYRKSPSMYTLVCMSRGLGAGGVAGG